MGPFGLRKEDSRPQRLGLRPKCSGLARGKQLPAVCVLHKPMLDTHQVTC